MKKKGLIISTVVMVVVLVASLTTATFAWFTTTASAAIDPLTVMTQSSKGLEIALFTPGNSDTFTGGNATLTANEWKGTGTWGPSITFDNKKTVTESPEQITYMGVSGDGIDMYKLSDTAFNADGTISDDATLEKLTNANENYFRAYVAIKNTEEKNAKALQITSLSVTAQANANGLKGMAASLRIAVFGVKGTQASAGEDPKPYNQAPTEFTSANLLAVYAPFGNLKYTSGSWTSQVGTSENKYVDEPAAESKYASCTTGTHTITSIDQESVAEPNKVEGKDLKLGSDTIDKDDIFYMMIVIWFEGEDAQCSNYFAGGGAEISFMFGKQAGE